MSTISQKDSDATQAVFESSASTFTPLFLQSFATMIWESNLTANEYAYDLPMFPIRQHAPVDREWYIEIGQEMIPDSSQPLNSNTTVNASNRSGYINLTQSKLCGLPVFCSNQAFNLCRNVTLNECEECSMTGAGIFAAVCAILGLLIVLGNGMVVCVVIRNRLKDGFSMMKVSLAVADALTGFQLLVVALYNFHETIYNTIGYLDNRQLHLRGSPKAVAGGMFYLLTLSSSLYHLAFMSGQRFYAIKRPFKYRINNKTSVIAGILAIWTLSLLSASVPACLPEDICFTYQHLLFTFYISPQPSVAKTNHSAVITLTTIFFVIPFVFMSILTIGTGTLIRLRKRSLVALREIKRENMKGTDSNYKEVTVFLTVAMMQIGYVLTLIPINIVNSLYFSGSLDCSNIALPFTLSFYLLMANSLVNVIVYSIRDKRFRKYAIDFLCHCL